MTQALATARPKPSRPAKPPQITRKVRRAIHDMIWDGLSVADAANKHGIQGAAFSRALSRPSVQAIIKSELEVLRTSARPRAFRTILDLMDLSESEKIRLAAARHVDQGDKQGGVTINNNVGVGVNVQQVPGYLIDVSGHVEEATQILRLSHSAAKPLKDNDAVPHDA